MPSASIQDHEYAELTSRSIRLGCSTLEAGHLERIVARFQSQYGWIPVDDMVSETLTAAERAFRSFDTNHPKKARRSTYLLACVRNALSNLTARELRHRERSRTLEDTDALPIFAVEVMDDDRLSVVSSALSPLAYQFLALLVREYPKRRGPNWLALRMGLTVHTLQTLRKELRTTVPLALEALL